MDLKDLDAVMREHRLRGVTLNVYIVLLSQLDDLDWRPLKREHLARLLARRRASITDALTDLVNRGLLERRPAVDDPRARLYRLVYEKRT